MSARCGHVWCLTGALRKNMATAIMRLWLQIRFLFLFFFFFTLLISVSRLVRLSSIPAEMMQNERGQIKSELYCVVIKNVTLLALSH